MPSEKRPAFEHDLCGRCGGSGRYSYNQIDGDRCYGCGGSGWKLTKRGSAAQSFYRDNLMVPAATLKVGDLIRCCTVAGSFISEKTLPIIEIRASLRDGVMVPYDDPGIVIVCSGFTYHCAPDTLIRKGLTVADRREAIAKALAFQATLTKEGKPRKST